MKDTMPGAWANIDPYFNGLSPSAIETYYDRAMDKLMDMDFEL